MKVDRRIRPIVEKDPFTRGAVKRAIKYGENSSLDREEIKKYILDYEGGRLNRKAAGIGAIIGATGYCLVGYYFPDNRYRGDFWGMAEALKTIGIAGGLIGGMVGHLDIFDLTRTMDKSQRYRDYFKQIENKVCKGNSSKNSNLRQ